MPHNVYFKKGELKKKDTIEVIDAGDCHAAILSDKGKASSKRGRYFLSLRKTSNLNIVQCSHEL